jgi:hypothetical protein
LTIITQGDQSKVAGCSFKLPPMQNRPSAQIETHADGRSITAKAREICVYVYYVLALWPFVGLPAFKYSCGFYLRSLDLPANDFFYLHVHRDQKQKNDFTAYSQLCLVRVFFHLICILSL